MEDFIGQGKGKIKLILAGIVVLIVLVLGFFSTTVVPAGNTGVKVRMGAIQNESLKEGLNFKIPFIEKIVLTNNRTQIASVTGNSASKDLQTVDTTVSVNFRVNGPDSASLFKNVGTGYIPTIIEPAIQESVKSAIAKYTAEELVTKRAEVGDTMKLELESKVSPYGIILENLNIINLDFSAEFNKAIEAKQTATQEALKANEDLARIKIEAEQKVTQAQGEAKANEVLSKSIDESILRQRFIEKWDGKTPVVMGSEGNIMDISSLMK